MTSMTTMKLQQDIIALIKTWTRTAFNLPCSLVNNVQREDYVKMNKFLSTSSVSFRDLILHTQGLTRMENNCMRTLLTVKHTNYDYGER